MSRNATFRAALLDPERPVPPGLLDGSGAPAGRRFSVYRNNVAVSLTEALEQTFPIVRKLIGAENFRAAAGVFLRADPPGSPILSRYGAGFPDFLEGFAPLADLGYLADMARLEHALVRAYHAADTGPADPAIFGLTPPEDMPRLTFAFAPPVQLLRSPWPVFDIWRFNTEENAPQPVPGPQDVLVTRPEYDPHPRLLPSGGGALITALARGQSLGDALAAAEAVAPGFDLAPLLALLLQDNAVTEIRIGDAA